MNRNTPVPTERQQQRGEILVRAAEMLIEDVVAALRGKGVVFEHYDLPQTTRQGDVHVADKTKVAWFKDPDGNILSIVSE